MTVAFYPGSFDPPTLGHRDIISRGLKIFDELIVGVGVNPAKKVMFDGETRVRMVAGELDGLDAGVRGKAMVFEGLAVDACRAAGANVILRGLRNAGDFAFEMQMAGMNARMAPDIQTVFLSASPDVSHVAATFVRQIALNGGDVSPFVSSQVLPFIEAVNKNDAPA